MNQCTTYGHTYTHTQHNTTQRKQVQDTESEEALRECFAAFDPKRSGKLHVSQMKHLLTTMGYRLGQSEFDALMEPATVDNKGYVDYLMLCKQLCATPQ